MLALNDQDTTAAKYGSQSAALKLALVAVFRDSDVNRRYISFQGEKKS
jgi:hypothetical protein